MQKMIDELNNLDFTDEVGEMAKSFEEYQRKKAFEAFEALAAGKELVEGPRDEPEQEEPLDFTDRALGSKNGARYGF